MLDSRPKNHANVTGIGEAFDLIKASRQLIKIPSLTWWVSKYECSVASCFWIKQEPRAVAGHPKHNSICYLLINKVRKVPTKAGFSLFFISTCAVTLNNFPIGFCSISATVN